MSVDAAGVTRGLRLTFDNLVLETKVRFSGGQQVWTQKKGEFSTEAKKTEKESIRFVQRVRSKTRHVERVLAFGGRYQQG